MAYATYTPEARQDLKEIALWIGRTDKRPTVAAKVVRELKRSCDDYGRAFASGSRIGTPEPRLGSGYRVCGHKRWIVVFREVRGGIEVMRIVDGARDYGRIFGSD
jgi:plasmid stabilization system protein ParE